MYSLPSNPLYASLASWKAALSAGGKSYCYKLCDHVVKCAKSRTNDGDIDVADGTVSHRVELEM